MSLSALEIPKQTCLTSPPLVSARSLHTQWPCFLCFCLGQVVQHVKGMTNLAWMVNSMTGNSESRVEYGVIVILVRLFGMVCTPHHTLNVSFKDQDQDIKVL